MPKLSNFVFLILIIFYSGCLPQDEPVDDNTSTNTNLNIETNTSVDISESYSNLEIIAASYNNNGTEDIKNDDSLSLYFNDSVDHSSFQLEAYFIDGEARIGKSSKIVEREDFSASLSFVKYYLSFN